jgi:tetratricopeptide (TPR) repeat protein
MVAAIGRETRVAAANAMLNYLVQHAGNAVAQQAIAARGQKAGPLWTKAYSGLAGLYNASNTAPVRAAFTGLLGDMTIGARIGKPVDRDQQLAGDLWFYYGGRYGEYLGATKQAAAADYLPAIVEATPGRSEAYFTLAEYFHDSGDEAKASADYASALQLNPLRADVHDRLAVLAAHAGRNDQAVAEWKLALAAFNGAMNRAHIPPTFWNDLSDTLHHIGDARQLAALREDIDKLLRLYVRRNGSFQAEPLMQAVLAASPDAAGGVAWIADLSRSAADPVQFLGSILNASWIPESQKDVLYSRIVESSQAQVAQSFGDQQVHAQDQLWTWQIAWANDLLARKENSPAAGIVAAFSAEARKARFNEVLPLELRVAARARTLPATLARLEEPLPFDQLRNASVELSKDGDEASARRVMEFVYVHRLGQGDLAPSTFLGLAEIRLKENDAPAALALLRRMTLVSGEAFANLDPAAALLEKAGRPEAAEFLTALAKAEPWNAGARERLAALQGSGAALTAVAKMDQTAYQMRVAAALAIRRLKSEPLTGTDAELVSLSSQDAFTETAVNRPNFAWSRLEAASSARDAAARERLLSAFLAIDPRAVQPKVDLFRAALEARHDALAIAVARQLVRGVSDESMFTPWEADAFFNGASQNDRLSMARGLGEAQQRLGNLRAAALYFQIAQHIQPQEPVQRSLAAVLARLALDAKNEARRPVITDALEQDRLVRPKVSVR